MPFRVLPNMKSTGSTVAKLWLVDCPMHSQGFPIGNAWESNWGCLGSKFREGPPLSETAHFLLEQSPSRVVWVLNIDNRLAGFVLERKMFSIGNTLQWPKITGFQGKIGLKIYFLFSAISKGTNGYRDASFEPLSVKIGSAVSAVALLKESKKSN